MIVLFRLGCCTPNFFIGAFVFIGAKFIRKGVQFHNGAKFIRQWCFSLLGLDFMHLVHVVFIPGSIFIKNRFPVY